MVVRCLAAVTLGVVAFALSTVVPLPPGPPGDVLPPRRLPLAEPAVESSVERLFLAADGRRPAAATVDQWVSRHRDGEPLVTLGETLVGSARWQQAYGSLDDAEVFERLHERLLGRVPSPVDRRFWTDQLAGGTSRAALLVALSESPEHVARTRTPAPVPPRPALAPAGIEHSVARLHLGLTQAWPDRATLDADVRRYLDGTPLATLAEQILARPEAAERFGSAEAAGDGFVRTLFDEVLGRPAPASDLAGWRSRLEAGESRGSVAVGFTESPEMLVRTRTAAPLPAPIPKVLLGVGDSVMLGAVATIESIPGWAVRVDARGCRQPTWRGDGCGATDIPSGVDALRTARTRGGLGGAVVIQVGNNGPMSAEQFDMLMAEVADQRLVFALTLKEPRSYEAGNNAVITGATARWPNLRIIDWHAAASGHPEWFGDGEGIHLSRTGAQAMADLIATSLPPY